MRAINTQHLDAGTNICSLEGGGRSERGHAEEKSINNTRKGSAEKKRAKNQSWSFLKLKVKLLKKYMKFSTERNLWNGMEEN